MYMYEFTNYTNFEMADFLNELFNSSEFAECEVISTTLNPKEEEELIIEEL